MQIWFTKDYTGRPLADRERAFLNALSGMLSEMAPKQLMATDTALTAEGPPCLICLMPHRSLGGVSLVAWLTAERASVQWADVWGLAYSHDSLDGGHWVAHYPIDQSAPDFQPVLECIREQLGRRILVEVAEGSKSAKVQVRESDGRLQQVGQLGRGQSWLRRLWRPLPTRIEETSFDDATVLSVASPPQVEEWFRKS